jgi:hypothetical protein
MQNILAWEDQKIRELGRSGPPPDQSTGWLAAA